MSDVTALAELVGLQQLYTDVWGQDHALSEATARHVIGALGFNIDTPEKILEAHNKLTDDARFPAVYVLENMRPYQLAMPKAGAWELTDEQGKITTGTTARDAISLPPLPPGYYRLRAPDRPANPDVLLIVAPPTCWLPDNLRNGKRIWGLSAQLYSVISDQNFGMGDFGDLTALVKLAAQHKADLIGLNPLHALFPSDPNHYSPYAPSNRMFINVLYIDVTAVDGFSKCEEAKKIWNSVDFQTRRTQARHQSCIDYALVAKLKYELLRPLYANFKKKKRPAAFADFCAAGGEALREQAVFDALCEDFHNKNNRPLSWREWPQAFRDPASPDVAAFVRENGDSVEFYMWLQWLADTQLVNAQHAALDHGMEIGLYRDLAVGSESAGAEIWSDRAAYIPNVSIGAPPDEYNPGGQSWGLLAFNPYCLRERHYAPYIRLLRATMRQGRALRIDHAFGLARLFLIPDGKNASEGAYLKFPFEEMLAILRIESHRNKCCVIGEDLGTFPPNYKEGAERSGLLSYKVLYFEHEADGAFKQPRHYESQALATVSTHDLPTIAGWLQSADIDEKEKLHIYPSDHLLHKDRENRARERPMLGHALALNIDEADAFSVAENAQLYLARTPCVIVMMQMEDILGIVPQVNIPSTTTERPNWRMKLPKALDDIFADPYVRNLAARMTAARRAPLIDYPRATYRLQFHKDFTFYDAAKIVPYLARLGISHVYASPYLQARPGSAHGYDITDHNSLNPELGGAEGYEVFCRALREHNLKQILDFVPNHMGIGGADNQWWLGLLEWGQLSPYAGYFDVNWEPRNFGDTPRIVVPFLDDHYGDVLARGELKLAFDPQEGSFSVWYRAHRFGICPRDYSVICKSIGPVGNYQEGEACKAGLRATHVPESIARRVDEINNDRELLHTLLELQAYRLAYWRVASSDINFRRFFDINDLAGMRTTEDDNLFDAMHGFVLSLIDKGVLSGLRIDHIDGIGDPAAYCRKLKRRAGAELYLIVEKILGPYEALPSDWTIEGTSGYDALNTINHVFVASRGEAIMERIDRRFTGMAQNWDGIAYDCKCLILETTLASELQTLTLILKQIANANRYTRDYPFDSLKQALKEILGCFPVYRTYMTPLAGSEDALKVIDQAVNQAKKHSSLVDTTVYDFIAGLLAFRDMPPRDPAARFVRKFQQLSGPVMAKGVEDTAFYRFNRLISLNEVGAAARFGLSAKNFHQSNKLRAARFPHAMIATATHDTKHGEDLRMRLNILSERPLLWNKTVFRWAQFNRLCRFVVDDKPAPSPNDEYRIYQVLLGSWPIELMALPLDAGQLESYRKRLEQYLVKAMREAKLFSSWNNPRQDYEEAVLKFLRQILDPARINPFLGECVPLAQSLATLGMINSLGQATLKLTMPGVPDIYQGCELWDFNLVDPDNRRPVDYALRENSLQDREPLIKQIAHWMDGKVKQGLIHTLLQHRAACPDLYSFGAYEAMDVTGKRSAHVVAFSRSWGAQKIIVAVPILFAGLMKQETVPGDAFYKDIFRDMEILCPQGRYKNILTGGMVEQGKNIAQGSDGFPIIVLAAETASAV